EIGVEHRQTLLDLALGRDRDPARKIGDESAIIEIGLGGGDRGGAGHETSRIGQRGDHTLGYVQSGSQREGVSCKGYQRSSNRARLSAWPPASPSPKARSIPPTGSIISSMCARANSTGSARTAPRSCCVKTP